MLVDGVISYVLAGRGEKTVTMRGLTMNSEIIRLYIDF
jgi:hypothetical protein